MVNEIIDGIAKKIKSGFPDNKIYIDDIEQGLREDLQRPCFFIALLECNQEQRLGRRLWLEHNIDVHYFPQNEETPTRELNSVVDILRLALRYITIANNGAGEVGMVAGTGVRHEVIDGVLHFFISYNLFVLLPPVIEPYMETLEQNQQIKR